MPDFVANLLGDARLLLVDVGARGDIPPPWVILDGAADVLGFEPDAEACETMRANYARRGHADRYRVYPAALSGTGGKRTLYVTKTPSGSSMLEPNLALRDYVFDGYFEPWREVTLDTRTLADVLDELHEDAVHIIKLDVQGCELEIYRGLGDRRMRTPLAIHTEIQLAEFYKGEPGLVETHKAFSDWGYDLFHLHTIRVRRVRDGEAGGYERDVFHVYDESPSIAGRTMEVDAIYFRRLADVLAEGDAATVRRLAVAYCVYGYFSESYHLVERAESARILDGGTVERCKAAIVAWHRKEAFRSSYGPSRFWRYARLGAKAAAMSEDILHKLASGDARAVVDKVLLRMKQAWRS